MNYFSTQPPMLVMLEIFTSISFIGFPYLCGLVRKSWRAVCLSMHSLLQLNLKINLEIVNSISKKHQKEKENGNCLWMLFSCVFTKILSLVLSLIHILLKHGFRGNCFWDEFVFRWKLILKGSCLKHEEEDNFRLVRRPVQYRTFPVCQPDLQRDWSIS